jgi:hypothetical protein
MNRTQILKFKGIDSFVYGDTQLIYFVQIRDYLRNYKQGEELELFLCTLADPGTAEAMSLRQSVMNKASRGSEQPGAGKQQVYNFPPILSRPTCGSVSQEKPRSMLHQAASFLGIPNNVRVTNSRSLTRQQSNDGGLPLTREKTFE